MNPQSKAREFFFEYKEDSNEFGQLSTSPVKVVEKGFEEIHVIEKSAYDKAVEALKVISQYTSAYSGASSPEANLAKETLFELGVE